MAVRLVSWLWVEGTSKLKHGWYASKEDDRFHQQQLKGRQPEFVLIGWGEKMSLMRHFFRL